MKIKTLKGNWFKYLIQWGALLTIILTITLAKTDPEKYCPMGGLQAFVTYLTRGSLPCSMSSLQIVMGLCLAAAAIFLSKLFCAFLCPIGSIEDILTLIRKSLGFKDVEIRGGSIADKLLRVVKYGLLFWIFYSTATASELWCKNLDPYYAVATGFKGEITLWMSVVTVTLVLLLGLFIKRFWCRYICPLGAVSGSLKFWLPLGSLALIFWGVSALGLKVQWRWILAAFCLAGYLLEIFYSKPKLQVLTVCVDQDKCNHSCLSCQKACPYHINVPSTGARVTSVDCTLCSECVAACPKKALSIGVVPNKSRFMRFLPGILALALLGLGIFIGGKFELPTINVSWGVEEGMKLKTFKVENLKSVKCYGSSMAFKARMEKVPGVHGVKTYVGTHSVVLSYDPAVTTEDKVRAEIFVPSHFRIWTPDPSKISELKVVTIRTEKMYDKLDLNHLGLLFRTTGKSIFGLESEYSCPLTIRVYMSPEEELDESWFKQMVETKVIQMPVHGGGVKETPVDFEFVRMEKEVSFIPVADYLEKMFDKFEAEFAGRYPSADSTVVIKRTEYYSGKKQYIYEIANQSYEKPIIKRALPYLSNHLSKEEGVIGVYLRLNKDLVPSLQVRYAAPMTEQRLWELMTMDTWTITYAVGDVREENARMSFKTPGKSYICE